MIMAGVTVSNRASLGRLDRPARLTQLPAVDSADQPTSAGVV